MKLLWLSLRHATPMVVALVLVAASAHASGPVEQIVQIAFHPSDPDVMVLRYVNQGEGLFFSDDGGESWRLACADFMASQLPAGVDALNREFRPRALAVAGDGRILAGSIDFLWEGDASGCTWSTHPDYDGVWVTDFAPHPSDPDVLFLATGSNGVPNAVIQRAADGSLSQLGAASPKVQIFRLRVTETAGGLRIYQSAISGTVEVMVGDMTIETGRYVIRVSDDGGESYEEFPVDDPGGVRLVAVDPSEPDRIVAWIEHSGGDDEVLVSADRGATFTTYLSLTKLAGVAIAPDGRVLIAGELEDGVVDPTVGQWSAPSLDAPPTRISNVDTTCVGYQAAGDAFFACPDRQFGKVNLDDGSFTKLFGFTTVLDFVECEGSNVAATCNSQLCRAYCGPHFPLAPVCAAYDEPYCGPCTMHQTERPPECSEVSGGAGVGAGDADAGGADGGPQPADAAAAGDAGTRSSPARGDGCSCTLAGAGRSHAATRAGWLAFALLLAMRVRARLRSGAARARPSRS